MFNFGAGRARLTPAGGGTAVEIGVVQNATIDLKVDLKEVRGPYRYPIAVADGKGTASGTINFMQFWPNTLASILGATQSTGAPVAAIAEAKTIPGMTTYTVTLTNGATMVAGSEIVTVTQANGSPVYYGRATAGSEASSSVAGAGGGLYSITGAGVITFIAADAGLAVLVTYLYTPVSGINNVKLALSQIGMNTASTFQLLLIGIGKNIYTNAAQQFMIQLNACLAPSLKMSTKLDDFTDLALDYYAFIDASGNLGNFYMIAPNA